ncbi:MULTISPECIES: rRNA maturation RNase YbeY [Anaeromyxobacter]|uniref:rRNA maturation RNase YbeY n=1 Tax=Anaeromyxobacter TaxID=161492 RepID=UPI001F5615B0|nr:MULTISPECIES: rRNA maturation RNase YbeY [unclassified Anaeromyxobacter]
MTVRLATEHPRGRAAARRLRARAAAYLAAVGRGEAELSVLLVTDRRIRILNREWRGKDAATDVLSFPQSEPPGNGPLLGDVVISLDTAARRARQERRAVGAELDRYLAHGLLHLLGYDHERPADARRMARKEAELARAEGLVGAALREGGRPTRGAPETETSWTRSPTSTSTQSRSGSTARGTRARTSRTASRR